MTMNIPNTYNVSNNITYCVISTNYTYIAVYEIKRHLSKKYLFSTNT